MDIILANFDKAQFNIDYENGEVNYFVKIKNLVFRTTENYILIKCRSISKFLFGNNLMTLSREDIVDFVNLISATFHIPFELGVITRMDFGMNVVTDYSPEIYCNYFGYSSPYRDRLEQTNGLYYSMINKQICIYDKLKRMKNRKIPNHYRDKNVLRFEFRFKGRVADQLNMKQVLIRDLYDKDFLCRIINIIKDEYFNICKYNKESNEIYATGSIPDFINQFAKIAIKDYGKHRVFKDIKEWHKLEKITKGQSSRLKKRTNEILSMEFEGNKNDLIQELDRKVNWMANQMHYLV
ncbi:phage/plasmid replication protein [Membranihabitans maritimus]|uniref:phage/plasmid replication protein n=1 Tax=Membranihabitans maritimus TaxID=2904244 RepID=UPI001F1B964B|nr:phage/plasmid replication protein [Membranihabitans maritimus]